MAKIDIILMQHQIARIRPQRHRLPTPFAYIACYAEITRGGKFIRTQFIQMNLKKQ